MSVLYLDWENMSSECIFGPALNVFGTVSQLVSRLLRHRDELANKPHSTRTTDDTRGLPHLYETSNHKTSALNQ